MRSDIGQFVNDFEIVPTSTPSSLPASTASRSLSTSTLGPAQKPLHIVGVGNGGRTDTRNMWIY